MLKLPESLTIERSPKTEQALLDRSRKWLEQDERKPGVHASDLMDPRIAFFKRKHPAPISDRLVNMFLVGKIGHIIVLSAVDGADGLNMESDEGSSWSEDLEIWYSPDKTLNGIPRELKTTRSYFEPKTHTDLALYVEQLAIYMSARNTTTGQLWVLYLNLKDADGKTAPQWRAYTVKMNQEDLDGYKAQLKQTRKELVLAWETGDFQQLPLCRKFKCGKKNCEYWEECRPEGRYGVNERQWGSGGPGVKGAGGLC